MLFFKLIYSSNICHKENDWKSHTILLMDEWSLRPWPGFLTSPDTGEISPPWFCLSSLSHSEFRGGPCGLAPLLAPSALLRTPAQLHGPPVRGRGWHQHGAPDSAQLRGESAEAVLLVGHRLLLHHVPPLCHLLEHLCLWAAGSADPTATLMKGPPLSPTGPPTHLQWLQPKSKLSIFDLR